MKTICGYDCKDCDIYKKKCKGCNETKCSPFGKKCWIANYIEIGEEKALESLKKQLIDEFNSLHIEGMPKITDLYALHGEYINLEYELPNGKKVKFLDDTDTYFGNQVECEFNDEDNKKCFGLACNMKFLLVCEYGENGSNPEIVIYKRR